MRRLVRILVVLLVAPPLVAAAIGWLVAPSFLHPVRRPLSPDLVRQADTAFAQMGAHREAFDVRAPDGIVLRGWKVRAPDPNRSWVVLFHGVADNRMGVLEDALILLRAGYGVTMMDARAHGESGGDMATYGWVERNDSRAVLDALVAAEHPIHIFALGESMGAGIALQSAGVDSRIEAVVAESSFADLHEASYDYAGLQEHPWLGKTLFAPGAWVMLARGQAIAGFPVSGVSPVRAVASRQFPVLLICDGADTTLPCRHTEMIYRAASGQKSLWVVPQAFHTAALGYEPAEFKRRVLDFFGRASVAR
jgi:alpha-beta hydrolase superfamily lysophospholipase